MVTRGKCTKDGAPDSINEYKSAFSCTFLATKIGEITAAEGVRDRFLEKKKATELRPQTRLTNIKALFLALYSDQKG